MSQSLAYRAFGTLTAPLINKSAIKAEFASAQAQQLEAIYHYQETILNAYIEVQNLVVSLKASNERYELKKRETELLLGAVSSSKDLFKAGRTNSLEILYIRQNMIQAQLEQLLIKKEQIIAYIALYKALGGGWK